MKITSTRHEPKFEPITITLTLDTMEEAVQFYNIHNFSPICASTPDLDHEAIRLAIRRLCPAVYDIDGDSFSAWVQNFDDIVKQHDY